MPRLLTDETVFKVDVPSRVKEILTGLPIIKRLDLTFETDTCQSLLQLMMVSKAD